VADAVAQQVGQDFAPGGPRQPVRERCSHRFERPPRPARAARPGGMGFGHASRHRADIARPNLQVEGFDLGAGEGEEVVDQALQTVDFALDEGE
jgi:hypothetical protein